MTSPFLDSVAIATAPTVPTPVDPGFEQAPVGGGSFAYEPSGSAWAFAGLSGLSANGSAFTSGNPAAPDGNQVAFLQTNGSFSQSIDNWSAGAYTLSFLAAQRGNNGGSQEDFQILIDGLIVGTFLPTDVLYQSFSTASFTVSDGRHTITFQGLDDAGGDNTAFIDGVKLAAS